MLSIVVDENSNSRNKNDTIELRDRYTFVFGGLSDDAWYCCVVCYAISLESVLSESSKSSLVADRKSRLRIRKTAELNWDND